VEIVIYEPSARRHFSHMSALFETQANVPKCLRASRFVQYFFKRTLAFLNYYPIVPNLVNRWRLPKIYFHSFEIFNIQIGEMTFCTADFIIIKLNYFRMLKKADAFWIILKH
jgi:hypothetical protein